MDSIRDIVNTIFKRDDSERFETIDYNTLILFWGGLFLAVISLVLTVFNVVMSYWFMAETTACLALGFAVACVLARAKRFEASRIVMALICALTFSMYAVAGENDGFAILWILLIPIIGTMLLGLRIGFLLSLYFQIFLVVIFYTPVSAYVADCYTQTFSARFPVLYLTSFVAVTFLMYQRQKLYVQTDRQATHDSLTGLLNRHEAGEMVKLLDDLDKYPNLSIACLDINRLKWVNDNLGHHAGDELIAAAAHILSEAFPSDKCFRMGGDEFMVISMRSDMSNEVRALREKAAAWHGEQVDSLSFAVGIASRAEHPTAQYEELFKIADKLMYQDKSAFYRQSNIDRRTR